MKGFSKSPIAAFCALSISFAITSCGGSKPPQISEIASTGEVEVTTPRNELTELAQEKYSEHFWGIGDAVSTKEQIASQQASLSARAELAAQMKVHIENRAKNSALNTAEGDAIEVFMNRTNGTTDEMIANTQPRKTRTTYNKTDGKYHVYTLVSVARDSAYSVLKNKISADQTISDVKVSKAIMDFIDAELDKGESK